MSHPAPTHSARHAVTLMVATLVLCAFSGETLAQASARAAERRAKAEEQRQQQADGSQQAAAPIYPDAIRTQPDAQPSAKLRNTLAKLFEAFNAKDSTTTVKLADEVIANPAGNAYDHAIADRLAGASLLNTDNDKAKAYLQQAVDFNGLNNNEHFESMRLIAQIKLNEQDYAGALAAIEPA